MTPPVPRSQKAPSQRELFGCWDTCDCALCLTEKQELEHVAQKKFSHSLEKQDIFLCSMKLKNGMYKNFYLVAVTRNLFYFIAFIPEATCLEELRDNEFMKKMFTKLTLHKAFADSTSREVDVNNYTKISDCCTIMIKVDANIGEFLFPKYKQLNKNSYIKNRRTNISKI